MSSGVPLTLSQTQPDFESLVLQLQLYLNSRATWTDLLTSSTGQTLVEMMAAVGTFNQFAIETAAREGFLTTAIRDSSIYAITRMLGVRISRKSPAQTSVLLVRGKTDYVQLIPRFSQFFIDGSPFFNRNSITFAQGDTSPTTDDNNLVFLYAGTVKVQTIPADSSTFREIYLNEPGFVISDSDLDVSLVNPSRGSSTLWSNTSEGIWTAGPLENVYYDSTSGLGDTVLAFGDGYHGTLPSLGNNIVVQYVVTNGSLDNNGGSGLTVSLPVDVNIQGKTTTAITGGSDQKSSGYYKSIAPHLYKARTRAVTPIDYKAIVSSYPGVSSVTIQTQRDIDPDDLRFMNVVRVCVLPSIEDHFTDNEWYTFSQWFKLKYHAAIQIQRYDPVKITVPLTVTLSLKASAVPSEVIPQVQNNIKILFSRTISTLGRRIALSDIVQACKVSTVDYVEIVTPAADLVPPDTLTYFELGKLVVNAQYSERTLM